MRIQTVVQHAGPRRAHLLPALLAALPPDAQVITDPGTQDSRRNPWRCYRACLETLEPNTTHLLCVQDDAEPCRDFRAALQSVVTARPDDVLALFVPGIAPNNRHVLDACWRGERWARLDPLTWLPLVAVVWPRSHVSALLEFHASKGYPATKTADDGICGDYCKERGVQAWATVPSLVEHSDREPSLVGTAHFGGLAPNRVAACWVGRELSGADFVW